MQDPGQEDIKPHKVRYYWNGATPSSSRRWHRFCVVQAKAIELGKLQVAVSCNESHSGCTKSRRRSFGY